LKNSLQDFFYSLVDYEKSPDYNYDLDAYKNFLDLFDAPQKKLKNAVLIGGTKGKGSTAAILNSCLIMNGYKVGLYSSPHLSKINERIRVNSRNISDAELEEQLTRIKPFLVTKTGARTFFEALTTIAFTYFVERNTEFSVFEVGLGGRLDATNATDPLISVITRIGYDHTNLLGSTLSQITNEKAGIIREHGKLITIHQRPDAEKMLKKVAKDRNSNIIFADEQHHIEIVDKTIKGSRVRITGRIGEFEAYLPLAGTHQIENLLLALAVLFELQVCGFYLDPDATERGIATTHLHGRFDVISEKPLIIFDCAHNQDSYQALDNNLQLFNIKDFYLVFGTNRDKDISHCLTHIFPRAKRVFLVKADNPRALEPQELLLKAKKCQENTSICNSVNEAIDIAKADPAAAIIITGSFYLWPKEWKV
jgi:dihydrofolate synthase/folylpolyglutamate synthase